MKNNNLHQTNLSDEANSLKATTQAKRKTGKIDIFFITSMAMFVAILIIMAYTPLGALNLGFITATIAQVPVIIGAIVLGKKSGMFLGGVFGFLSAFTFSTVYAGTLMSYIFSPNMAFSLSKNVGIGLMLAVFSLITAFAPRILIGFVSGGLYNIFAKRGKQNLGIIVAGIGGSAVNTLGFLLCLIILFGIPYANGLIVLSDVFAGAFFVTVLITGLAEAAVSAILAAIISKPILIFRNKK